MNKLIEGVLRTPGLYCYENDAWAFFFEVDAAGVVHQLKPHTMERDGVLSPDGWREPGDADRVRRVWPREDEASWRAAVDEMLTVCGGVASDDPRESINRLIDWHVQVALDPTVSSEARTFLDKLKFSPEQRLQLDAGVALRRHAEHVRRVRELIGTGKSLVITPLSPNGTTSTTIETPPKHRALIARQGGGK